MTDDVARVAARHRERWLAQARDGVARLEDDPRDPVARGLLGEAAARLTEAPTWVTEARDRFLVPVRPELPLRTERLVLRRLRLEDAADLHAYYGRDDVAAYLLAPPVAADEAVAEIHRRLGTGEAPGTPPEGLGLVMELDGRVVGDVVLMFKPPHYSQAELGWVVHPDVAGRGLATEAARAMLDLGFGHYGFHRITAELDARNERSARLAERLGMRREAHRLADYWSKGAWTDSLQYALTAAEWAATRS
jgi:RimJ/RimL family protein N-acetyltransferase